MPIVFAFLASLTVHLSVMLSDGWTLPSLNTPEELDVVLAPLPLPVPPASAVTDSPPERKKAAGSAAKPVRKSNTAPVPTAASPEPLGATTEAPEGLPVGSAEGVPAAMHNMPAVPVSETSPVPSSAPALPMPANRLAQQGTIRYNITRGESGLLIGQSVHHWEHADGRYTASAVTETIGIAALFVPAKLKQASIGVIDSAGLKPEHFRNEQRKRTDEAFIERAQNRVRSSSSSGSESSSDSTGREAALTGIADTLQDTLSMYYQLCLLFSDAAPPKGPLHLPIATGRKLETYRFELVGEEVLNYRLNHFATQHLRTRSGDDTVDLWIVPNFPLPLRIRFVDRKGDIYDQWMDISNEGLPK